MVNLLGTLCVCLTTAYILVNVLKPNDLTNYTIFVLCLKHQLIIYKYYV